MNSVCQEREYGPDCVKAFAILLVVIGHTLRGLFVSDIVPENVFWGGIDKGIYLFHMPLFFFLSGTFIQRSLQRSTLISFIKRNSKKLIIPLIFWSYLQMGIQYLASSSVNSPISLYELMTAPFPPRQQFWFLSVLFLILSFAGLVLQSKNGKQVLGCISLAIAVIHGIAIVVGYDLSELSVWIFPVLRQVFFYLPFFTLGLFIPSRNTQSNGWEFLGYIILFIGAMSFYLMNFDMSIMNFLTSVICVYATYNFFMHLSLVLRKHDHYMFIHRIILFIGANSMIIYLAHIIAASGLRIILFKLGVDNVIIHIIGGVIAGVLCPLILVPIGVFLMRYNLPLIKTILPVKPIEPREK